MNFVTNLLITAPPLLFSLTLHELAHARAALAFGDPTARNMGRVTLNPLAHLDLIGTICLLFSGLIGWAKPVPVNVANLHPRRLGNITVSVAGVCVNLLMAAAAGLILRMVLPRVDGYYFTYWSVPAILMAMLWVTMVANMSLFLFNLIPLHPLDGSHVLQELLPFHMHHRYIFWQHRYGMYVLAGLILVPHLTQGAINPVGQMYRVVQAASFSVLNFSPEAMDSLLKMLRLLYS